MIYAHIRSLRATTAICAALGLGSAVAWAQDTAPSPDASAVRAPASPSSTPQPAMPQQPSLQVPTAAPAPPPPAAPSMVSQPVIQQTPQIATSRAASPAEPAKTARARSAAPRQAAQTAPTAPSVPVARNGPAMQPQAAAVTRAAEPAPQAVSVSPAPPAAQATASEARYGVGPGAWIAAVVVVLGASSAGVVALRSRRRRDHDAWDDNSSTEAEPAIPANEPISGLEAEAPLAALATVDGLASESPIEQPETIAKMIDGKELVPATKVIAEHEAFVMPTGLVPQTRAERDALLKKMAAAPPDADNPFTSRKARLRRARIMLQSLEHKQKEEATKPFDWRTYEPSTSHPAPATPPRVTV